MKSPQLYITIACVLLAGSLGALFFCDFKAPADAPGEVRAPGNKRDGVGMDPGDAVSASPLPSPVFASTGSASATTTRSSGIVRPPVSQLGSPATYAPRQPGGSRAPAVIAETPAGIAEPALSSPQTADLYIEEAPASGEAAQTTGYALAQAHSVDPSPKADTPVERPLSREQQASWLGNPSADAAAQSESAVAKAAQMASSQTNLPVALAPVDLQGIPLGHDQLAAMDQVEDTFADAVATSGTPDSSQYQNSWHRNLNYANDLLRAQIGDVAYAAIETKAAQRAFQESLAAAQGH